MRRGSDVDLERMGTIGDANRPHSLCIMCRKASVACAETPCYCSRVEAVL